MRLPVDGKTARLALIGATSAVALGAGMPAMAGLKIPFIGDGKALPPAPAVPVQAPAVTGPAADYPVVLGDPYRVGDRVFTPSNAMNYDAVGYASVGGPSMGVSAAHHTLPLPSYVEVTSLTTGHTILVRVERRGPMDSTHAIELSPAAAAQLGIGEDGKGAVRVRRVNPLETERAALRAGASVGERMVTPKPLLAVLQRRLASDPMASHAGASLTQTAMVGVPQDDDDDAPVKAPTAPVLAAAKITPKAPAPKPVAPVAAKPVTMPPAAGANFASSVSFTPAPAPAYAAPKAVVASVAPKPAPQPVKAAAPKLSAVAPAAKPAPKSSAVKAPVSAERDYDAPPRPLDKSYLIQPLSRSATHTAQASHTTTPAKPSAIALEARVSAKTAKPVAGGEVLVVQIGAFSDKAHASAIASKAGGSVSSTGSLWRVRKGPYSNRGEAEAALAKAKASGYTEARIQHGE